MKNKISMLAIALFMFTAGANAQEVAKKEVKKEAAKAVETVTADTKAEPNMKKECTRPKKGCCAAKKEEAKT